MQARVIDTNVPLTASGANDAASTRCVSNCIDFIERVLSGEIVIVLDDSNEAMDEYGRNVPLHGRSEDLAGRFLIHVFSNMGDSNKVRLVTLLKTPESDYIDYPDPDDSWTSPVRRCERFDPDDKKWVAIALRFKAESDEDAPIANAADRCWHAYHAHLDSAGVALDFLCLPQPTTTT